MCKGGTEQFQGSDDGGVVDTHARFTNLLLQRSHLEAVRYPQPQQVRHTACPATRQRDFRGYLGSAPDEMDSTTIQQGHRSSPVRSEPAGTSKVQQGRWRPAMIHQKSRYPAVSLFVSRGALVATRQSESAVSCSLVPTVLTTPTMFALFHALGCQVHLLNRALLPSTFCFGRTDIPGTALQCGLI